ncbi:MAG: acyl-CoA dehydrogenase, partial [Rhodothermales bacterium]|nr:acyl-CoA dehydrogenase [Rhodothermales bacterium]
ENALAAGVLRRGVSLGAELYLGLKPPAPTIYGAHPSLETYANSLAGLVRTHSHSFKLASKWYREDIITRQVIQARLADNAVYLFALSTSLSKMDRLLRSGVRGVEYDRDKSAFVHAFDLFELAINANVRALRTNADESMRAAASTARRQNDTLANEDFYIHESSPVAAGSGKRIPVNHIRQFPGEAGFRGDGSSDGAAHLTNGSSGESVPADE